jgi:hypothetical protein
MNSGREPRIKEYVQQKSVESRMETNKFNLGDEVHMLVDDEYFYNFKIVSGKVEGLEVDGEKIDVFVKGSWAYQESCYKDREEAINTGLEILRKRFDTIITNFKETGRC